MASGHGQPEKGKHEAKYESRSQTWKNSNPGRSGYRSYGSTSAGSGDQWSMAHGWYSMDPWTAANAWTYPSPMTPQSQWGMTNGWSGWSAIDPSAVIQGGANYGQDNQWRMNTGSTASGSGDQWSTRAWTSQDSTRSWSTETTVSSNLENRETRTAARGATINQRKVPLPPPLSSAARASCRTQESTAPPPGGPSAGGGRPSGTSPKKPTDDAWKDVERAPPGVPYPDPRGMKS
eukprot:6485238-Amphidinium_carterae.1